jgi:hypothetical protein
MKFPNVSISVRLLREFLIAKWTWTFLAIPIMGLLVSLAEILEPLSAIGTLRRFVTFSLITAIETPR